jgi:hypothetical protein
MGSRFIYMKTLRNIQSIRTEEKNEYPKTMYESVNHSLCYFNRIEPFAFLQNFTCFSFKCLQFTHNHCHFTLKFIYIWMLLKPTLILSKCFFYLNLFTIKLINKRMNIHSFWKTTLKNTLGFTSWSFK